MNGLVKLKLLFPNFVVLCLLYYDSTNVSFDDLLSFYNDDLPNSYLAPSELLRWKGKWERQGAEQLYGETIKVCNRDIFPNVYVLLCALPVTLCENERANSTLKNLKTSLRNTMGPEQLSSLSLMHIHYDFPVDLNNIVDKLKCSRILL